MRSGVHVFLGVFLLGALAPASVDAADPKFECIDAHTRAQDLRREGHLLAARAALVSCSSSSCPPVISTDCAALRRELDPIIPSVVIEVRDEAGNAVAIETLTIDGRAVSVASAAQVELDPGQHLVVVESIGRPAVEQWITVQVGEKRHRAALVVAGRASATAAPAAPPPPQGGAPAIAPAATSATQRVFGILLGGVGITSMSIGAAVGFVAKSDYDRARRAECPDAGCSLQGKHDTDEARSLGTVGSVLFVVGAVALVGGVILWLTAPTRSPGTAARLVSAEGVSF